MAFDYSKLNGRIAEMCGSQKNFAEKMGLSARSMSLKMNSKVGWKQEEIHRACGILDIIAEEIPAYFFKAKVQN